jgi:hypothetical protein
LAEQALKQRRSWSSEKLGQRLGLTYDERCRLKITVAWAIDVPKEHQIKLRQERRVEAQRKKRHQEEERIPRPDYLETAKLNKAKREAECAAEGISERTWRRRRKAETANGKANG